MAGILAPVLGLGGTLSGLYNVRFDKIAGVAGAASLVFYVLGEAVWRSKAARETMNSRSAPRDTDKDAADGKAKVYDRATTLLTGLALSANQIAANAILWRRGGFDKPSEGVVSSNWRLLGIGIMAAGALLRRSAMLTLGSRFSMALAVMDEHKTQGVCDTGVYSVMRHPGYAANGCAMIGYQLAVTGDLRAVLASAATWLVVWGAIRIPLEERMLAADPNTGDAYKSYKERVRARMIPFLF